MKISENSAVQIILDQFLKALVDKDIDGSLSAIDKIYGMYFFLSTDSQYDKSEDLSEVYHGMNQLQNEAILKWN